MEKLQLQKREVLGKKVRHLRKEGLTPAVVYNSKGESFNTSMSTSDAEWLYRNTTSTTILDTELEKDSFKTLVKEFSINPVTEQINHVSLFKIDESVSMIFTIPFNIVGISPAVKNNLGVLVNVLDSIDVRCKLSELQPYIEIDISNLDRQGQTINVNDIELPKGMSLINDDLANATIVTITEAQKVEEIVVAPTEEESAEGEETPEGEEATTPTEEAK
jgi:large subunit ribosomal protein L25